MLTVYHCRGARSLRVLWTLEEMGLAYEPVLLPFPPRVHAKSYLEINRLGTIPFFIDDEVHMTESSAICLYLTSRFGPTSLRLAEDERDHASFLNWLFFADATLTFPQTVVLRYRRLEPTERRNEQAARDYEKWFFARLRAVEAALADREYLCADRFTIADIVIAYALHLADSVVGLSHGFGANVRAYLNRARMRSSFIKAMAVDERAPDWR
jgi:glutathione S-transferase